MVNEIITDGDVSMALSQHWANEVTRTGEDKEGVTAFLEKRTPHFPYRRDV
jgi:1,4-dihydroxy-2-naphthoyl-CoA synthase